MNIFKRLIDPMIGKTVIHFSTHGCMAQIEEFDYIGEIVDTTYPRYCDGKKFYKVSVFKKGNNSEREFEEVPSWYLQKIGGNIYVAYD